MLQAGLSIDNNSFEQNFSLGKSMNVVLSMLMTACRHRDTKAMLDLRVLVALVIRLGKPRDPVGYSEAALP